MTPDQVSWHPHSDDHLVVLTSDNRLRLYNVPHSLAVAEQTFHVLPQPAGTPGRYGMAAAAAAPNFVAFAFGPPSGWGLLTVLLLSSGGLVYGLCPVAPFGGCARPQSTGRVRTCMCTRACAQRAAVPSGSRSFPKGSLGLPGMARGTVPSSPLRRIHVLRLFAN